MMNTDTNDAAGVPPVVVISAPPEPEPEPEVTLDQALERVFYIRVAMPRVRAVALCDYDGRGGRWRGGAVLELDLHVFEEANSERPYTRALELSETLPETVERKMRRLRGQQGERCSWAEYVGLRDRLRWEEQQRSAAATPISVEFLGDK